MLTAKTFTQVATVIFTAVALMHLLRLVNGWGANIGGWDVPMWVSILGLVVAGFLAYSGFMLFKKGKK